MKKIILIYCITLISCGPSREEIIEREKGQGIWSKEGFTTKVVAGEYFEIVTIDSCQYIYHYGHRSESLIHKANCKNHGI